MNRRSHRAAPGTPGVSRLRWTQRDMIVIVLVAAAVVLVTVAGLVAARASIQQRAAGTAVARSSR